MLARQRDMDMCSGPLFKKILLFSLPIMAMNLLQLLFNAADMVVVGRYSGSEALGAVGATGSLINLIVNLFMGLSVGTSVLVAQDYGSGRPREIGKAVHTSIYISLVGGIFVMALGLAVCRPLLVLMGTPDDIMDMAALYMQIYFLGMPANMIYNFAAAVLRAVGDSRRPMYYLIISGVVNVVFNMIFVIGFGMGVGGVAWATVISQYLSVTLIMICLMRSNSPIRFEIKKMKIDRAKLIYILKIGLPAGLQGVLFSVSNVLIQSAVNSFGSVMVAASAAESNIEGFVGTSMNAYSNAAITFTGQNVGARKPERVDSVAKITTALTFITWILLGGLVILFGRQLLGIYVSEPEVIDLGMIKIRIMMTLYISCALMSVFPGLSRGMGFSVLPMICTLVGACLMRIVWLATVFDANPSIWTLFTAYPVSWTLAAAGQLATFFYARKKTRARIARELAEEAAQL